MKYYFPKNFCVQEYVPPDVFEKLGEKSILLIDDRVLKTDDALRDFFGVPITINNWHLGGDRKYSGFRPTGCTVGAVWSQHRYGRASDKIIKNIPIGTVITEIVKNSELFPYIRVIEKNVSWLHTDCRNTIDSSIQFITP